MSNHDYRMRPVICASKTANLGYTKTYLSSQRMIPPTKWSPLDKNLGGISNSQEKSGLGKLTKSVLKK